MKSLNIFCKTFCLKHYNETCIQLLQWLQEITMFFTWPDCNNSDSRFSSWNSPLIYTYMWDLYYIHLLARIPYLIPVFLRKWQPPSDEVTHHMIFEVLHSSTRSKLLESRRIHYFHMKVFCQDDSTGAFSWKLYGSPPALRYM